METLAALPRLTSVLAVAPLSTVVIIFIIHVFKDRANRRKRSNEAQLCALAGHLMEQGHTCKLSITKDGATLKNNPPPRQKAHDPDTAEKAFPSWQVHLESQEQQG